MVMRTITLEEHYASPAFLQGPGRDLTLPAELAEQLSNRDDGRSAAIFARRWRDTSRITSRAPRVASGGLFTHTPLG